MLQKNFSAIMEEPEKVPDWLSTGITYLLPKSGDSKEVRDYQPIMCLTTMYKTLTGIKSKGISTHLEEKYLLPAQQNGCHPGSKTEVQRVTRQIKDSTAETTKERW
jgi:hypothetical protein